MKNVTDPEKPYKSRVLREMTEKFVTKNVKRGVENEGKGPLGALKRMEVDME